MPARASLSYSPLCVRGTQTGPARAFCMSLPIPSTAFPARRRRKRKWWPVVKVRSKAASPAHRVPPAVGVQDENVHDRIKDMDVEGRDIDFLIPGTWATAVSGLPDITLTEAL